MGTASTNGSLIATAAPRWTSAITPHRTEGILPFPLPSQLTGRSCDRQQIGTRHVVPAAPLAPRLKQTDVDESLQIASARVFGKFGTLLICRVPYAESLGRVKDRQHRPIREPEPAEERGQPWGRRIRQQHLNRMLVIHGCFPRWPITRQPTGPIQPGRMSRGLTCASPHFPAVGGGG